MEYSSPFNLPEPQGTVPPAGAESGQTLWHLTKNGLPGITAVLRRNGAAYELDVSYGHVAQQRLVFACPVPAAARAEALRDRLEAAGYRPQRRDKRRMAAR